MTLEAAYLQRLNALEQRLNDIIAQDTPGSQYKASQLGLRTHIAAAIRPQRFATLVDAPYSITCNGIAATGGVDPNVVSVTPWVLLAFTYNFTGYGASTFVIQHGNNGTGNTRLELTYGGWIDITTSSTPGSLVPTAKQSAVTALAVVNSMYLGSIWGDINIPIPNGYTTTALDPTGKSHTAIYARVRNSAGATLASGGNPTWRFYDITYYNNLVL